MQVTFVAHVVNTENAFDPGLLVVRIAYDGKKPFWVRIAPSKPYGTVRFASLQDALDDMRMVSRCGSYACATDIEHTNWSQELLEKVVRLVIDEKPELLVA